MLRHVISQQKRDVPSWRLCAWQRWASKKFCSRKDDDYPSPDGRVAEIGCIYTPGQQRAKDAAERSVSVGWPIANKQNKISLGAHRIGSKLVVLHRPDPEISVDDAIKVYSSSVACPRCGVIPASSLPSLFHSRFALQLIASELKWKNWHAAKGKSCICEINASRHA